MAVPRHIVDEIRSRVDIVELIGRTVTLRKKGTSWTGLCPFHSEKTPSFNVVPNKGIYHCFGCGEGGDAFKFLIKTQGMSFMEAVKDLASATGIVIEEREATPEERARLERRADLYDVVEAAAKYFENTLLVGKDGAPGREYLATRGVTLDTARKYRLGYAPDGWQNLADYLKKERYPADLAEKAALLKRSERTGNLYDVFRQRLIFPILDERARPIAFGGRILPGVDKEAPKYLNSPGSEIYEKSKVLYGLSWARTAVQRKDRLIIVEGYFDAVSLWQAGFEEAAAPCGTALTVEHLEVIKRLTRRVIALFDGDEAGLKAATKSLDLFLDAGVEARRLDLPGAKDPDEFIQKNGASAFEERLGFTEPVLELVIRRSIEREGTSAEGQSRALGAVAPLLRKLPLELQGQMISRAAGWLGVHEAQVRARMGAAPTAAPAATAITRWIPDKDLVHVLWLVAVFPEKVGAVLAQLEPEWITDRPSVLEAIALCMARTPLPAVLERLEENDPEVARTLRAIVAREALYPEERAFFAMQSLAGRIELKAVEARIVVINREMHRCETTGDKSSYRDHAIELSSLYTRKRDLSLRIARRSDDKSPV